MASRPATLNTHDHLANGPAGSQTTLQYEHEDATPSATLRLRAEAEAHPRVRWAEDVVDNEGMGKKSSKVCCIYHKPHEPGDSDSDSDSSSSSDESDSEPDFSRAQRAGGHRHHGRQNRKDGARPKSDKEKDARKERRPSPNAYERQPKHRSKAQG